MPWRDREKGITTPRSTHMGSCCCCLWGEEGRGTGRAEPTYFHGIPCLVPADFLPASQPGSAGGGGVFHRSCGPTRDRSFASDQDSQVGCLSCKPSDGGQEVGPFIAARRRAKQGLWHSTPFQCLGGCHENKNMYSFNPTAASGSATEIHHLPGRGGDSRSNEA